MKTQFFIKNERLTVGTTLKDVMALEENNTAFHVAKNEKHVLMNRENLAKSLHYALDDLVCANQTHSANFHKVTLQDKGRGATSMTTAISQTDALYTYEPNMVLCSFTADCVPMLFYHTRTGVIGAIHSGWPGTTKEITIKTLQQLIKHEDAAPEDFHVYLGPALSQEKFEVDEDVYWKYKQLGYADEFIYFNGATNKYHIDNQKTVKKQCELVGVPSKNIVVDGTCTFLSKDHFSYREDKQTGRHLGFIVKR